MDPAIAFWENQPHLEVAHDAQRHTFEDYRKATTSNYNPKTVLRDEISAWRYWITLGFADIESDNWQIYTQFDHDLTFTWTRMLQALEDDERQGRQYHFNLALSRPPSFWVLQQIDKKTGSILEMWTISETHVVKCSTVFQILQARINSVSEHLSATMDILSAAAPDPSPLSPMIWQSTGLQRPNEEASGSGSGVIAGEGEGVQQSGEGMVAGGAGMEGGAGDRAAGAGAGEGTKKKMGKKEQKQAFDIALNWAYVSMKSSIPPPPDPAPSMDPLFGAAINPVLDASTQAFIPPQLPATSLPSAKKETPKTREEQELDRLMHSITVNTVGPGGRDPAQARGARGEKRTRDERIVETSGSGKQARFEV